MADQVTVYEIDEEHAERFDEGEIAFKFDHPDIPENHFLTTGEWGAEPHGIEGLHTPDELAEKKYACWGDVALAVPYPQRGAIDEDLEVVELSEAKTAEDEFFEDLSSVYKFERHKSNSAYFGTEHDDLTPLFEIIGRHDVEMKSLWSSYAGEPDGYYISLVQ